MVLVSWNHSLKGESNKFSVAQAEELDFRPAQGGDERAPAEPKQLDNTNERVHS
jgi:hypothetical protein